MDSLTYVYIFIEEYSFYGSLVSGSCCHIDQMGVFYTKFAARLLNTICEKFLENLIKFI